jgi:hypothetical protein
MPSSPLHEAALAKKRERTRQWRKDNYALMTPLHAAAIQYVAEGYRIIPCRSGTKLPMMEDWLGRALETKEQVNDHFSIYPNSNIAFCPADVGIAVVDVDPGANQSHLNLPPTRLVLTPRGGWHHHFVGSCRATVGLLGEHIDTRGQRSYALLPPSVTEHGTYVWEDDRPAVALPLEIEARLAPRYDAVGSLTEERDLPANVERGRDRLRALVRRGVVAKSVDYGFGGGDNLAYQVAAELVKDLGLSENVAIDLLLAEWYPHCIPNNVPEFIIEKVHNVARYGQNEAGAHAVSTDPFPAPSMDDNEAIGDQEEKKSKFHFMSPAEMMAQPLPEWIVPDLIPEGALCLLTAAKGSFKSFLALAIALGISTGRGCFDIPQVLQGCTFYGAHEGFTLLSKVHRVAWCQYHGFDPLDDIGFYMSEGPRLAMVDDFAEFGKAIKRTAKDRTVRLIVIDTYSASMMGCDENDPGDANRFIYHCRGLLKWFPKAAILVPAHFGKDSARGTRGTNALEAGFDTLLTCTRGTGSDDQNSTHSNHVSVKVVRQRGAPEREQPIYLEGRKVANSLVFLPTPRDLINAARKAADPLNPSNVAALLMEHGFVSADRSTTTTILAGLLCPQFENEVPARYVARIKETERSLVRLAQSSLHALTYGAGRERRWCFEPTSQFPAQTP